MSDASFPLLVLQPTLGSSLEWAAVRLRGADAADVATLQRVFGELGLAEAARGLACLLSPAVIERLAAADLPESMAIEPDADAPPVPMPAIAPGKGPAKTLLLKVLSQIAGDAETRDIEGTLKNDPQLSVQLLRLVNSVAFAPTTRINSFAHAITLLGRRQLQRWLQLLLYASQAGGAKGNPLLATAAMRAMLMEELCKAGGGDRATQDEAFMVGMFSQLEALFSQPLASIIEPLKLLEEVSAALLQHKGKLGDLLTLVEAAEQGPEAVAASLARTRIDNETWCRAQIAALCWALQVGREQ